MKIKSIFAIALCVTALLSCNRGSDKIKIGAAVYGLKGEYVQNWVKGLKKHPYIQDNKVDLVVFDGDYDANTQQSQFETMAAQNFDGILFIPIDVNAGIQSVNTAKEAGIPVVGSNARVLSDDLLSFIGSDDVKSGYDEAKFAFEQLGGVGNVVIIEGPIGQSGQVDRLAGNKKALTEYPGIQVIAQRTANWSRAEALNLMEDWLVAYPGEINAVIGQNDEMALGAIQAIKQAGLNTDDFVVVGIDGVQDSITAVANGEQVLSILQDAVGQSQGALDILLRKIIGADYQPSASFWETVDWDDGQKDHYNVPWVSITKENVAQFQ